MHLKRIVVHMKNGEIAKGYSSDFSPDEPLFHLVSITDPLCMEEIRLDNLKAVFFVKDFNGDFLHVDTHEFGDAPESGAHIMISFFDGEILFATSENIDYDAVGFFIHPIDPEANTESAFVVNSFIHSIEIID